MYIYIPAFFRTKSNMAYLALVLITFQGFALLALPILAAIVLVISTDAAFVVWPACFKHLFRVVFTTAFNRTKVASTKSDLIDCCFVFSAAVKASSRDIHPFRSSGTWLKKNLTG